MKNTLVFAKNCILSIGGIISLIVAVYLGAIGFMMAVVVDKLLQAIGSKWTMDKILYETDIIFHNRYEEYRHTWENFHFKDLKLPF